MAKIKPDVSNQIKYLSNKGYSPKKICKKLKECMEKRKVSTEDVRH
jgi:hypothetical protein